MSSPISRRSSRTAATATSPPMSSKTSTASRAGVRAPGPAPDRRGGPPASERGGAGDRQGEGPREAGRADRGGQAAQDRRSRPGGAAPRLDAEMNQRLEAIPNLTHPDAPVGQTEDDSRELRKVGTPRVFDFQGQGPRRTGQGPRPDRLRDRRQGQRDRLLLPQERRGAARPGASAVRDRKLIERGIHSRSSRPTWPAIRSWRGSASRRGAPRRRSTRSRTPTSAWSARPRSPWAGCSPTRSSTRRPCRSGTSGSRTASGPRPAPPGGPAGGSIASTSSPRSRCSPSRRRRRRGAMHAEMLAIEEELFQVAGDSLPRARHLHGRPRRPGLSQVRPRSLDARPRRTRRIRRGHQHLGLHRLSGPAAQHPLSTRRPERDAASSTRSMARPSPSAGR